MGKFIFVLFSIFAFSYTNCPKLKLQPETIIQHVNIIDVENGSIILNQDVIIREGKIASIGKSKAHKKSEIIQGDGEACLEIHFTFN